MKNFANATPDRAYETYCPQCKWREPLTWGDMQWLQTYQRMGQHPHYRCILCPFDEYGMHPKAQVRMVRRQATRGMQWRMTTLLDILPTFDEEADDLPTNYGIEHSHDGGWYPYHIEPFVYLKDSRGLDLRCASRDDALCAMRVEVAV